MWAQYAVATSSPVRVTAWSVPAAVRIGSADGSGSWPAGATWMEVASATVVDHVMTAEEEVTVSTDAPKICCGTSGISNPVSCA